MKAYSPRSLIWQTVSLDANGTGILISFVGEVSGARPTTFHLNRQQATILRRLVNRARHVPEPTRGEPMAELDWLHISGAPAKTIHGPAPAPLTALVRFLDGLMQTYCC